MTHTPSRHYDTGCLHTNLSSAGRLYSASIRPPREPPQFTCVIIGVQRKPKTQCPRTGQVSRYCLLGFQSGGMPRLPGLRGSSLNTALLSHVRPCFTFCRRPRIVFWIISVPHITPRRPCSVHRHLLKPDFIQSGLCTWVEYLGRHLFYFFLTWFVTLFYMLYIFIQNFKC